MVRCLCASEFLPLHSIDPILPRVSRATRKKGVRIRRSGALVVRAQGNIRRRGIKFITEGRNERATGGCSSQCRRCERSRYLVRFESGEKRRSRRRPSRPSIRSAGVISAAKESESPGARIGRAMVGTSVGGHDHPCEL